MTPTQQLIEEHEGIKVMLDILGEVSDRLESGTDVAPDDIERILEFFKVFADKCHHGKEEDLLFPALERSGMSREGGLIGLLMEDHAANREDIKGMTEAAEKLAQGEKGASRRFAWNAWSYIGRMRTHIEKENLSLFPTADERIPEEEQRVLLAEFEKVEEERIGKGRHEEFHRLLDRLKSVYL